MRAGFLRAFFFLARSEGGAFCLSAVAGVSAGNVYDVCGAVMMLVVGAVFHIAFDSRGAFRFSVQCVGDGAFMLAERTAAGHVAV